MVNKDFYQIKKISRSNKKLEFLQSEKIDSNNLMQDSNWHEKPKCIDSNKKNPKLNLLFNNDDYYKIDSIKENNRSFLSLKENNNISEESDSDLSKSGCSVKIIKDNHEKYFKNDDKSNGNHKFIVDLNFLEINKIIRNKSNSYNNVNSGNKNSEDSENENVNKVSSIKDKNKNLIHNLINNQNHKSIFNSFLYNKFILEDYEENLFISESEKNEIKQNKVYNQAKSYLGQEENPEIKESKEINNSIDVTIRKKQKNGNKLEVKLELKVFDKIRFRQMKIIGQFNKGFIIAILEDEIFIIDQHAADEKFNYENLIKNAKVKKQPLLKPLLISNLSMAEKITAFEYKEIFRKLGFELNIDTNDHNKLYTYTIPTIYNYKFKNDDFSSIYKQVEIEKNKSDFSQLFEKDSEEKNNDNNIVNNENSKIKILLSEPVLHHIASKACRSSIMIGNSLDMKKMRNILFNLSTCLSPWNCPHGRPTMRFLKKI